MIADGDARSLLGKACGDSSADTGRTARDENIFAGEIGNNEARSGHQGAFWLGFDCDILAVRRAGRALPDRASMDARAA
jgi:hypothetical protein